MNTFFTNFLTVILNIVGFIVLILATIIRITFGITTLVIGLPIFLAGKALIAFTEYVEAKEKNKATA